MISTHPAIAWFAGFRLLNLRYTLGHRARTVISTASVALSVSLITGLFATYGSLAASVERFGDQLAGNAMLEVSGLTDGGFDETLLGRVESNPHVAEAIPMIRTVVNIDGRRVVLLGVDKRITALRSSLLQTVDDLPSTARFSIYSVTRADRNELVVGPALARSAGLRAGMEVPVTSALGGTSTATLFSTVDVGEARFLNGGYWAIANLHTAQRLTGRHARLDSILVVPKSGSDLSRLQQDLLNAVDKRAVVAPPQFRVAQASDASSLMRNMTLFVAAIAFAVAGFLIFNTFSMAAIERHAELAVVRALGGRRTRIARDFLLEAGLLGLAGCAIGIPLGVVMGRAAITSLPPFLTESFDARIEFSVPGYLPVLALLVGVGTSIVGAWAAAGRVLRITPLDALRTGGAAEVPVRRSYCAVLVGLSTILFGMAALVVFADQRALLAGPLVICGVLIATYPFAGLLSRVVAWLIGRAGVTGTLASIDVARVPRRIWATTMTIAVTSAIGVATYGGVRDVVSVVSAPSLGWTDFYVKPTPPRCYQPIQSSRGVSQTRFGGCPAYAASSPVRPRSRTWAKSG